MGLEYKKAKEKFLASDINGCQKFFADNNYILELAYCEIITDNLDNAKSLFYSIRNQDIRAQWGMFLIAMIELNVRTYPTYFELRNFLEIDLNILINNFKGEYVENILRYADFMSKINPEVYKFIGRVFYNNSFKKEGMYLFEKAKDVFYQDPELHYLLAVGHFEGGRKDMALHYAQTCQEVLPEYCPAVKLERELKQC